MPGYHAGRRAEMPGLSAQTLRDGWLNQRVAANYQRLRQLQLLDEFPRNAAGRILKRELRAAILATPQGAGQP